MCCDTGARLARYAKLPAQALANRTERRIASFMLPGWSTSGSRARIGGFAGLQDGPGSRGLPVFGGENSRERNGHADRLRIAPALGAPRP